MYNQKMHALGSNRSVIRELFEFGKIFAQEKGADKVFDFSLGNPNVPAPESVREALQELISYPDSTTIHGYTSAQGDINVLKTVANSIKTRFGIDMPHNLIYMTVGAAAALTITLNALYEDGDEVLINAPYFPEYRVFSTAAGYKCVEIEANSDMTLNLEVIASKINSKTKAIIVNSPNNPTGVVYSEEQIKGLCEILATKSKEIGHPIFLISDEPYREIVYDNAFVPYLMNYYDDTIVCYSYSKSLSMPGERIGYIAISPKCTDSTDIYYAVCGAGRSLGYVCAPNLFQKVIAKCIDSVGDIDAYKRNRDLLLNNLTSFGYECIQPQGAFYLFVKAPNGDAGSFSETAKKYGLLLVPSDSFGIKGYVRISYCVSYDMISRSLPYFNELMGEYVR